MIPSCVRKILTVDLSSRKWYIEEIDEELYHNYLGGSGISAKILYDELDTSIDPTAPQNAIIFMNGLLTGTFLPTANKMTVCARSPLTVVWCESTVGGYFPAELSRAGLGGVVIRGKSDTPVYIWINGSEKELKVEIVDCEEIWRVDPYMADDILKHVTDPRAQTAMIGLAGVNLVKISNIIFGGKDARAAGRGGLGAVMGSKNLKALVVRGTGKRRDLYDKSKLIAEVRKINKHIKEYAKGLTLYGTAGGLESVELHGDLPIKNWQLSEWKEGVKKTSGQAMVGSMFDKSYACYSCPIGCGKILKADGESIRGPEYEATAGFGAMCLNEDMKIVVEANQLCNIYGRDTISTSSVIAFAMEACEKGFIDGFDGVSMSWGDGKTILEMIHNIAGQDGLGKLLGEGVKRASETLGHGAEKLAIHTKGLEYPYHDPRAFIDMAINYATANRGACHLESFSYPLGYGVSIEEFGYDEKLDPHINEGKAEIAVNTQNLMTVYNALGLCKFLFRAEIGHELLNIWINYATGWDNSAEELMLKGEHIFNLKRLYNTRLGIGRKDDSIPERLLTPHKHGPAAGSSPDLDRLLDEYYQIRGWTKNGIPS